VKYNIGETFTDGNLNSIAIRYVVLAVFPMDPLSTVAYRISINGKDSFALWYEAEIDLWENTTPPVLKALLGNL